MKPKLKIFEHFSNSILPHESQYLSKLSNFQDDGKLEIFTKVIHNAQHPDERLAFDESIDKRKYHYIKTWVENKLSLIDVDKVGNWILEFKRKLYLDLVTPSEEKEMLMYIRTYSTITFNFNILYEAMREYRSYLMIRLRYEDHEIVKHFLDTYQKAFEKSNKIKEKLYNATTDITWKYTSKSNDNLYWEKWLYKVFKTVDVDGSNRYKAFILLAFLYTSQNDRDNLQQIFDDIDGYFASGQLYSRRLLYNYYSSRVLLHSKQNDIRNAIYYGKLSIRQENEDTLMYVNNLVSIYLRSDQMMEAKKLLEEHRSHFESSHNSYQRITFMSYQIRVLAELKLLQKAENLGIYFLKKHEEEILQYRWHHFFTSYINVLLIAEKYEDIVMLQKKYSIIDLEKKRKKNTSYVPNLSWAVYLSMYMENRMDQDQLIAEIRQSSYTIIVTESNQSVYDKTVNIMVKILPELSFLSKSHVV